MSVLTPGRKSGLWILATFLAFLAAESLVFRTGWYNRYLEPDSAAGTVEFHLYWLNRFRPAGLKETLVVGDSRVAEGFGAQQANELPTVKGERYFWSVGMPGTSPRVWYYMLRDADPTRRRFENIVIALDGFADRDLLDSQTDRIIDLNFAIGRIQLGDVRDFASSLKTVQYQREAMIGGFLKGTVYRHDVQALFQGIDARLAKVAAHREHGLDWYNGYQGNDRNLAGLTVDWKTHTINYPPGLDDSERNSIQATLMPALPPQTGETTRYRRLWLGRIIDLYRNSPTRVVFLQLPRAPLPLPPSPEPTAFINWACRQPNVSVLEARTFAYLESPEFFFDGLHLNRAGRASFSTNLASRIPDMLANK